MSNLEKGKATKTGVFFQTKKEKYDNFQIAVIKSKYNREEILEKLMDVFEENGDAIFDFIFKTK